jgi:hypothetical protein
MSKGSQRRPQYSSDEVFAANWARTFAKSQPTGPALEVLPNGALIVEITYDKV